MKSDDPLLEKGREELLERIKKIDELMLSSLSATSASNNF